MPAKKKKSPSGVTQTRKTQTRVDFHKAEKKQVKEMNRVGKKKTWTKDPKKSKKVLERMANARAASNAANESLKTKTNPGKLKGDKRTVGIFTKSPGKIGKFGQRLGRKLPVVGAALTGLSLVAKAKKVRAATKKKKKKGKK